MAPRFCNMQETPDRVAQIVLGDIELVFVHARERDRCRQCGHTHRRVHPRRAFRVGRESCARGETRARRPPGQCPDHGRCREARGSGLSPAVSIRRRPCPTSTSLWACESAAKVSGEPGPHISSKAVLAGTSRAAGSNRAGSLSHRAGNASTPSRSPASTPLSRSTEPRDVRPTTLFLFQFLVSVAALVTGPPIDATLGIV